MGAWESHHGWAEVEITPAAGSDVALLSAKADHRILIRRIRGMFLASDATSTVRLKDNATAIGPTLTSTGSTSGTLVDIPGLEIRGQVNKAMTLTCSANITGGKMSFQYAYEKVQGGSEFGQGV